MSHLHKVQIEALNRSKNKRGFGFLMQQGLGKTLTTLEEFNELSLNSEASRMVVICPNSFKGGWVDEINKWGYKFQPHIFESGNTWFNDRFLKMQFNKPPVLIINYEAIRSPSVQEYIRNFISGRPCYIAGDESIQMKTHNSSTTKSALPLSYEFAYRRILSGKWMSQGPHDIWAQLRFIGSIERFNYFAFRTQFCKMGGFRAKQVVGARNEDKLAEIINPVVFQALKDDWTDLPPKIYTTREYMLSEEVEKHYLSMYNDFVMWLNNDETISVDAAISKYVKLAQIQCGFVIDENGNTRHLVSNEKNSRLKLLLNVIENEVVGKFAIAYTNKAVFEQLYEALKQYNPSFIKGEMKTDDINLQKRKFNEDPSCRCILLQTVASKYGHTLLGGPEPLNRCSTMIFYQNTYNLDDRSQIEDRIHRHGQTANSVLYIDLAGTNLDKSMVESLQRKEDIYRSIMKNINGGSSLSQE